MENNFLESFNSVFEGAKVVEAPDDNINWDTVEAEGGYEPLPEGHYNMTIEKAEYKQTPKGDWQVAMTYAVEGTKRKVFDNLTVKDRPGYTPGPKGVLPSQIGLGRIKTFLKLASIDPKEFKLTACYVLVGHKFNGKVKIDTYNPDKPRNKVTFVGAYVEPKSKPVEF